MTRAAAWHHDGMERAMPSRHRPLPFTRLAPHLLSVAIALMAVVALPLCLPHEAAPETDADARTVTEARDIVEIVTTPGVHLLHHAPDAQIVAAATCPDCAGGSNADDAGAARPDEPRAQPDESGQRAAVLPPPTGLADAPGAAGPAHSDPARTDAPPDGASPPPRTAAA